MIAEYEDPGRAAAFSSPRLYGLTQRHKHLKEMAIISGLEVPPVFCPIVADFFSGMAVTVSLFARDIKGKAADIAEVYKSCYKGPVVFFEEPVYSGMVASNARSGSDDMKIGIAGNDERILLISQFDNLGKGACGAAIQNMNIILGIDESTGLVL